MTQWSFLPFLSLQDRSLRELIISKPSKVSTALTSRQHFSVHQRHPLFNSLDLFQWDCCRLMDRLRWPLIFKHLADQLPARRLLAGFVACAFPRFLPGFVACAFSHFLPGFIACTFPPLSSRIRNSPAAILLTLSTSLPRPSFLLIFPLHNFIFCIFVILFKFFCKNQEIYGHAKYSKNILHIKHGQSAYASFSLHFIISQIKVRRKHLSAVYPFFRISPDSRCATNRR